MKFSWASISEQNEIEHRVSICKELVLLFRLIVMIKAKLLQMSSQHLNILCLAHFMDSPSVILVYNSTKGLEWPGIYANILCYVPKRMLHSIKNYLLVLLDPREF